MNTALCNELPPVPTNNLGIPFFQRDCARKTDPSSPSPKHPSKLKQILPRKAHMSEGVGDYPPLSGKKRRRRGISTPAEYQKLFLAEIKLVWPGIQRAPNEGGTNQVLWEPPCFHLGLWPLERDVANLPRSTPAAPPESRIPAARRRRRRRKRLSRSRSNPRAVTWTQRHVANFLIATNFKLVLHNY